MTLSAVSPANEKRKKTRENKAEDGAAEVTLQDVAEVKKSKKRKAKDEATVSAGDDSAAIEVKEKKRKRKAVEGQDASTEVEKTEVAETKREKKKRRKEKEGELIVTQIDETNGADEGAGDVMAVDPAAGEEEHADKAEVSKKEKRKKRKDSEAAEDKPKEKKKKSKSSVETTQADEKSDSKEKKKKSKKKRADKEKLVDLPDPESDEALSDQARKALLYTYAQFDDPPNWKFNKARQNWLIRNIWSDQAIPSTYLPLVTRYLSNVQGGVRENLIKTCQTQLASTTSTAPETADTADAPKASEQVEEVQAKIEEPKEGTSMVERHARANAILAVLNT
ncbi:hypothetical protein EVG20_g3160 [Dentipellis fragilis]|uniref:WKF domain-containing protein n=1 Tax=Dentipellis fragilis TaxID=205917 RepID=A0A4Y9Z5Y3_9AGAM|nr:hypothetical protein EVG20_g3160 [Dentipellis fragilis]